MWSCSKVLHLRHDIPNSTWRWTIYNLTSHTCLISSALASPPSRVDTVLLVRAWAWENYWNILSFSRQFDLVVMSYSFCFTLRRRDIRFQGNNLSLPGFIGSEYGIPLLSINKIKNILAERPYYTAFLADGESQIPSLRCEKEQKHRRNHSFSRKWNAMGYDSISTSCPESDIFIAEIFHFSDPLHHARRRFTFNLYRTAKRTPWDGKALSFCLVPVELVRAFLDFWTRSGLTITELLFLAMRFLWTSGKHATVVPNVVSMLFFFGFPLQRSGDETYSWSQAWYAPHFSCEAFHNNPWEISYRKSKGQWRRFQVKCSQQAGIAVVPMVELLAGAA